MYHDRLLSISKACTAIMLWGGGKIRKHVLKNYDNISSETFTSAMARSVLLMVGRE